MKALGLLAAIATVAATAAYGECESTPKPLEDSRSVSEGTLLLKSGGRYFVIDQCVRISRYQFGSSIKLGFLNNFDQFTDASFFSVKTVRTLELDQRIQMSLVRSAGWYGYEGSNSSDVQSVPPIKGDPFKGSIAHWNEAHSDGASLAGLSKLQGLRRPWHAYVEKDRLQASNDDAGFWLVDQTALTTRNIVTNYLIRFVPSRSYTMIDFDIFIQEGVQKVDLVTTSQIESLAKSRTLVIVP